MENLSGFGLVIVSLMVFLILGLINSKFLSPLNRLWFKFGIILGAIVAPIVMGVIFFFSGNSYWCYYENNGQGFVEIKNMIRKKETYWINRWKNPLVR